MDEVQQVRTQKVLEEGSNTPIVHTNGPKRRLCDLFVTLLYAHPTRFFVAFRLPLYNSPIATSS